MAILFKRAAELVIGPKGGQGKIFRNLRINFQVEQTSESNSNKSTIKIFNLNEISRGETVKKDSFAILKVGFLDNLEILAIGDISKVITNKEGPDFITTAEIGDGEQELQKTFVNKTFEAGVTLAQVIRAVVSEFGIPFKIKGVSSEKFNQGIALSGTAKKLLEDLVKKQDLEYFIQGGQLIIKPKGESAFTGVIRLTTSSGLVGSPSRRGDGNGIEFSSLLNAKLRPGQPVQIQSKRVNGIFIVRRAIHTGDNIEGEWITKCEAI